MRRICINLSLGLALFVAPKFSFAVPADLCPDRELCVTDCCADRGGCSSVPGSDGANNSLFCSNSCGSLTEESCTAKTYCKYNTNASDFNYLELSNHTTKDIYGSIVFVSESGTTIKTSFLHLSPSQRKDVDVHTIVGASKYGQIFVNTAQVQLVGSVPGTSSVPTVTDISAAVSHYYVSDGKLRQTVSDVCVGQVIY